MAAQIPENEGSYFIDAESLAEMTRLLEQDRVLTRNQGGVFPDDIDLSNIHDVLDLACGPGGWAMDVARAYPAMRVTGIDISNRSISYAAMLAKTEHLEGVTFRLMDVFKPLDFPAHSFDFINARLLAGFMPTTHWPVLLQECMRILRPGGYIRLTESEFGLSGITNSPATEKINLIGTQALKRAGYSFSPDGMNMCMTPMLHRLLSNAGLQHVRHFAFAVDYSVGTEFHETFRQLWGVFVQLLSPFFFKFGTTTKEEFDQLYQQMQAEWLADDFVALWYLLSAYGQKPVE